MQSILVNMFYKKARFLKFKLFREPKFAVLSIVVLCSVLNIRRCVNGGETIKSVAEDIDDVGTCPQGVVFAFPGHIQNNKLLTKEFPDIISIKFSRKICNDTEWRV